MLIESFEEHFNVPAYIRIQRLDGSVLNSVGFKQTRDVMTGGPDLILEKSEEVFYPIRQDGSWNRFQPTLLSRTEPNCVVWAGRQLWKDLKRYAEQGFALDSIKAIVSREYFSDFAGQGPFHRYTFYLTDPEELQGQIQKIEEQEQRILRFLEAKKALQGRI